MRRNLNPVMDIFDAETSEAISFKDRLDAAEALGQSGDPRLDEDNWITIPAGEFLMGSDDEEAYNDAKPRHAVYLGAFQVGRFPVTVQEFATFIDKGGYKKPRCWKDPRGEYFRQQGEPWGWKVQSRRNHPVTGVSWYEAAAYCEWLSDRLTGRVRLLTEAEWERAACGGKARKYPWGDQFDSTRANYACEGSPNQTTPVGLYPRGATPEKAQDMAGNVWEWVADWYADDYYLHSPQENPQGPLEGSATLTHQDEWKARRIVRGGGWSGSARYLLVSNRVRNGPDDRYPFVGFRCAREVLAAARLGLVAG